MLLVLTILAALFLIPSPWDYIAVLAAAVVEAGEVAFFVRYSRRRRATTGAEGLVGAVGTVVEACRPLGRIRVLGELWTARCDDGADPGERVIVESLDPDLTLVVRRAPI